MFVVCFSVGVVVLNVLEVSLSLLDKLCFQTYLWRKLQSLDFLMASAEFHNLQTKMVPVVEQTFKGLPLGHRAEPFTSAQCLTINSAYCRAPL